MMMVVYPSGSAYILKGLAILGHNNKPPADDVAGSDYFGTSVAIDGDTVIVGAFKIVWSIRRKCIYFYKNWQYMDPATKNYTN